MQKITPFLWFNNNLDEAVQFYTQVFKDSKIVSISRMGDQGPAFSAVFQLNGQDFYALNGGPQFTFNEAVSFFISCENQDEVDYYWQQLTAGGGQPGRCGWLKDQFGLSWQVVPVVLNQYLQDKNKDKANKVMQAMMQMDKMDIQQLTDAYNS